MTHSWFTTAVARHCTFLLGGGLGEGRLAEGVWQVLLLERDAVVVPTHPPRDLLVDHLVLALRLVLPLVVAGAVLLVVVLILVRVTLDARTSKALPERGRTYARAQGIE